MDDPVCAHLPEFGARGKVRVTFRHLLTHTAGMDYVNTSGSDSTWEETVAKICGVSLRKNWVPGREARYDVSSAWFILGEVVSRKSGMALDGYVHQQIFAPDLARLSWTAPGSELWTRLASFP